MRTINKNKQIDNFTGFFVHENSDGDLIIKAKGKVKVVVGIDGEVIVKNIENRFYSSKPFVVGIVKELKSESMPIENTYETISNVIQNRFKEKIISIIPGGLPTEYDNENFIRPENSHWARLSILFGDSFQKSIGSVKRFRTVGIMAVQVFTPTLCGCKKALKIADFIESNFRLVKDSVVMFRTPSIGRVRGGKLTIKCPFFSDKII